MELHYSPIALILVSLIASVKGHGYMIDPPSRNACWKVFPGKCPANYNANEQNCGGRNVQISLGGKCGVCGDKYGVKRHVNPGRYATGFLTKTYKQGQEITVKVHITANHKGWFEFRVGDIGSPPITQEKLTYLLKSPEGKTRYYLGGSGSSYEYVKLVLPPGLKCIHCVLQWWWKVGNSWGCDDEGCGIGNGDQETFVNCADIQISHDEGVVPTPSPKTKAPNISTSQPASSTHVPPVSTAQPKPNTRVTSVSTKEPSSNTHGPPLVTTKVPPTSTPSPGGCKAIGAFKGQSGIDKWCVVNCAAGFCPTHMCSCNKSQPSTAPPTRKCRAIGPWKGKTAIDDWCVTNCAKGFCPSHMCICN